MPASCWRRAVLRLTPKARVKVEEVEEAAAAAAEAARA
jgi:hypothetical protein